MTPAELPTAANPGPFGHKQRKNFLFPENYTQFNHGSYGTFPKVVQDDIRAFQDRCEQNPDRWNRCDLFTYMDDIRTQLAEFINCDKAELALVNNTTAGVNTVLRSLPFVPGDRILVLSTGFIAVNQTVRYICDAHEDVKVIEVPVTFPLSDKDLLNKVEEALKAHQELKDGSRIKLGIVDWISSVPSVIHPVKELVELLHSYGALVYVDGAHTIGQVPVDLEYLRPDFYITNCHKWLFSARGSALLYVAKRHQHLIHPISITGDYNSGFEKEFSFLGTQDYSSIMSILTALKFRKQYGEDAIISYTHSLAIEGGKAMAKILGTHTLTRDDDDKVGNMVNVALPIKDLKHPKANNADFMKLMLDKYNLYTPAFIHGDHLYTRVSAQIYLELEDFVRLANIWKEVIEGLNASS